jgi:predicted nucleic acid-binding protein
MATFLLDSSVIIDTINGKRGRAQILKDLINQGHLMACCSINVTEVFAGMRPHEEIRTTDLLKSLQFYPVTFSISRLAGLLKRDHAKKGISLATTDVTIAAVAIAHQLTLITDNVKHYPMKELTLYSLPN